MEPKRRGAALLSVGAVPQGKLSLTQRIGRPSFLRNVPDSCLDARPVHGPVVELSSPLVASMKATQVAVHWHCAGRHEFDKIRAGRGSWATDVGFVIALQGIPRCRSRVKRRSSGTRRVAPD